MVGKFSPRFGCRDLVQNEGVTVFSHQSFGKMGHTLFPLQTNVKTAPQKSIVFGDVKSLFMCWRRLALQPRNFRHLTEGSGRCIFCQWLRSVLSELSLTLLAATYISDDYFRSSSVDKSAWWLMCWSVPWLCCLWNQTSLLWLQMRTWESLWVHTAFFLSIDGILNE